MSQAPADKRAGESSPEGNCEAEENLARRTSPTGTLSDFLKEYKIPKKYTPGSDSEEGELSDPYEEENRDQSDGNVSDQGQSPPHTRVSDSDEEGPSRFDPLGDTKKFSLDKSKEKYARKFFNRHVTEDVIQSEVLKAAPIPVNTFLCPPEADDYIEDMINDPKAMRFLKLQDHSLKTIQKKVAQVMGPLSKLWVEVDSNNFSDVKPSIDMFEVKELLEKTILLVGQTNATCLYERRLNFLAKIMSSAKTAKAALKENEAEFQAEDRLFGTFFYKVMDRKAKSRKRAREMSRDIREPATKKPFRQGPPERKTYPSSRGAKSNNRKGEGAKRRNVSGKQNRYVCKGQSESRMSDENRHGNRVESTIRSISDRGTIISSQNSGREDGNGILQSPSGDHRSEISRHRTMSHSSRGQAKAFCSKLGKNNFRSAYPQVHRGLRNKFLSGALSEDRTQNEPIGNRQGNFKHGNSKHVVKKRSGDCISGSRVSIFEYFVCPSEEGRGRETHFQSENSEQMCNIRTFQNGRVSHDQKSIETKRLHGESGSEGCIPLHSHTSKSQKVSAVQMGRQTNAVSKPSLRFGVGSQNFHENYETHGIDTEKDRNTSNNLPRRYSSYESDRRGPNKGSRFFITPSPLFGMADQLEQIGSTAIPDNRISGPDTGLEGNESITATIESRESDFKVQRNCAIRPHYNSQNCKFDWLIECYCRGSSSCRIVCEGVANAQDKMSSENPNIQGGGHSPRPLQRRDPLVDPKSFTMERETNYLSRTRYSSRDRRISGRVGVPLSSAERKIRGSMERPREKGAHKCSGNDGSRHRSEVGNKRPTQNTCTCENGQCHYSQICKQNGGHQIPETDSYCKTNMAVLPHERDYDYCRTPAWNSQQNSGLGKQARVQRQHEQLETESRYFQTNRSPSRAPRIGSVCGKNERPNRQIFQLETRPPGCGVGRIHQNLDRGKSVRVSPILPYSKSISKNTKGKCTNCADSTSLAHTSILPNASRNDCQQSNSTTTSEGPPSVARGTRPSTSSKQHVKTSGMADLRRTRQMQGLSADAAELWVSAWRSGTQSAYDSCWRKWASWCREGQINPFQASVENVANFLSDLYTEGYEYSTINNYRSAISAIHPEIGGEKVGQKHTVKQVMTGIFNKRPPLPRYTNTWDVDVVLNHIQNMPSNKDLCLKNLSIKTATLIALTSAARASEICALDTKFMQITDSEISFTVTDLTKTRKVKDTCGKVTFPSFEDSQLDVRSCIIDYLKATEPIRTVSKLLVSYVKPHNAIKPCSMARWLKTMLGAAGIDTNVFKAHSTRGACTSKANKFGLSVDQIMKKASWKSATTFQRFYNKPIQGEDLFTQTVLATNQ